MQTKGIDVGVGVMVPVTAKLDKFEEHFKRGEKNSVAFKAESLEELSKLTGMPIAKPEENHRPLQRTYRAAP